MKDLDERFWSHVLLEDPIFPENGCMVWTGAKSGGYGRFWVNGGVVQAFRWIWERMRGPLPEGFELDHLCRRRACVNPDHMESVTHRENVLRSPTSLQAINARKTHCVWGHEFTPENTYYDKRGGWRKCKQCTIEQVKARRKKTLN